MSQGIRSLAGPTPPKHMLLIVREEWKESVLHWILAAARGRPVTGARGADC